MHDLSWLQLEARPAKHIAVFSKDARVVDELHAPLQYGLQDSGARTVCTQKARYDHSCVNDPGLKPIFTARVRTATLWSLLPVKYCNAAPKLSRGSARTSTCNPSRPTLALALFSPRARSCSTLGKRTKRSSTSAVAGPVTSRSRSPTVSRPRRRLPAGVICSMPGVSPR